MITRSIPSLILGCLLLLGGYAQAQTYSGEEYVYAPQYYSPLASDAVAYTCGGTMLKRNQWSPWEFVEERCGVELHVRYNMKNKLRKRVQTTVQFRYVNTRPCDFTVCLYNVDFRLADGSTIRWDGETAHLGPHATLHGSPFAVVGDSPLCTFTKCLRIQ